MHDRHDVYELRQMVAPRRWLRLCCSRVHAMATRRCGPWRRAWTLWALPGVRAKAFRIC